MGFDVPTPFAWDSSFDVKVDCFNTEHKKLFDLINDLDANRNDGDKLKALLDYVVFHFKHEEELMEKTSYSDKEGHKVGHFVVRVGDMLSDCYNSGGP